MARVEVRYYGGAAAAAGAPSEGWDARTLGELMDQITAAHGARLATVLTAASILVDGVAGAARGRELPDGATVDVLPPFAGG